LSLPTDRPRPVIQTFEGDRETLQIDATTTDALSAFARARGVTLTMLLTSLFGVLLHRLSGQEDVVIGMPVAGRDRAELEPLIGFFINTLPLRVRMGDDPTLADLLQRVRSLSLEALARQELPFEKLVEELRLERDMGYSPVYQAMLTVQNLPPADLSLPGLRIEPFDSGAVAAKVDIALTVSPDQAGTGLSAVFDYNRDLFDRATWTRWTGHFAALIEDMLAGDLDRQISRLALLRPADQAALAGLTGPDRPIPDQPLHDLVLSGLRAAPDKPALSVSSGSALSGAAVIAAVEDRAKAVVQAGIAPGDRVAVCVERGIDLPITLLAVWAAGASYVPMDPLFPPDRLALMLEDSGARAVVVSHVLQDALPSLTEGVLALVLEDLAPAEGSVALPKVAPDAEAYVIYTSGSTGRPKGVVLGQRSVANFLASMAEEPGLSAADTLLAVTTV
ncbi:MAG: condensation domain-containing protein, partial [Rhodospirillaceae bacterium]